MQNLGNTSHSNIGSYLYKRTYNEVKGVSQNEVIVEILSIFFREVMIRLQDIPEIEAEAITDISVCSLIDNDCIDYGVDILYCYATNDVFSDVINKFNYREDSIVYIIEEFKRRGTFKKVETSPFEVLRVALFKIVYIEESLQPMSVILSHINELSMDLNFIRANNCFVSRNYDGSEPDFLALYNVFNLNLLTRVVSTKRLSDLFYSDIVFDFEHEDGYVYIDGICNHGYFECLSEQYNKFINI